MPRWCVPVVILCITILSHLAQGSSSVLELPSDSQYYFVCQPRPPRIYSRAPSGLPVTKVLAKSKTPSLVIPVVVIKKNRTNIEDTEYFATIENSSVDVDEEEETELAPGNCFPHYRLHEGDADVDSHFIIGKCDGIISTAKLVEKPVGFIFNVTVLAVDLLNFTLATKDLQIEVTEINSKPPYLTRSHYSQEVLDTTKVGELIATVAALDNDTEAYNKEVYYSLQDSSNIGLDPWFFPTKHPLAINITTGEIYLTSSLLNMTSPLHFRVGVTDGGSPQRSHHSKMIIHIRNMSAPRNIKILNTTATSITVCWASPIQGNPEGYLISSVPRSSSTTTRSSTESLNVTVQQLESGTNGFTFDSRPSKQTKLPTEDIDNFFAPQYCATLDGLISYSNYAVSIRGWSDNKVSMARMPLTAVTRKRNCFNTTCLHGVCQEQNSPPGYSCRCSEEFYGEHCEWKDPCLGSLCENGATCIRSSYDGHYKCDCQFGFSGNLCEKKNICLPNPCQNNGLCHTHNNTEYQYRCQCSHGFIGANCEVKDPNIFNAMCRSENGSYPEGEIQWPSTFKGNTAFIACPYGVKEGFVGISSVEGPTAGNAEMETPPSASENINVVQLSQQEQLSDNYNFGDDDSPTLSRSGRSVLMVEAEMTIPFVPTEDRSTHGARHSRSVDSSVITSHMSSVAPPTTAAHSAQSRLNPNLTRASARVGVPGATRICAEVSAGVTAWLKPNLRYCKTSEDTNVEFPTPLPGNVTRKTLVSSVKNLAQFVNKALHDQRIAKRMVDAISNLLNVNQSMFSDSDEDSYSATENIMETIDTYTANVPLVPGKNIKIRAENLVVEAKVFNVKDLPEEVSFHPFDSLGDNSFGYGSETENRNRSRLTSRSVRDSNQENFWIKVPRDSLKNSASNHVRFQFVSFKDDRIFRSQNRKPLNMPVVSATVSNVHVCNLETPVIYRIPLPDFDSTLKSPLCVYWDKASKTWLSDGVSTRIVGNNEVQCESNHLTSFSIVLDPIATPIDLWHSEVLSIISYVGLTISTIALVATISTFALFRSLNRDRSGLIVMNLAIALLLLNISFLGAMHLSTKSFACIPFATMLHYAVAASFAWMLIEAQNMYQLLVTIFPSAETHFMSKRLLLGWGMPFGLVAVALIWNKRVYVNEISSYCAISPVAAPAVYYATYLAPITMVLMLNLIVFFRVTSVLCQRRPSYGRNSMNSPEKPSHKSPPVSLAQFRGAVTIVALLGITWVAGVFAIGNIRIFLQYAFTVTTPLQGLIIFIVRVLQSAEARVAWRSFVMTGSRRRRHPTQISSIRTHSSQNSSSMHTQSTGVIPPNFLTSALRRFSLSALSSQTSPNGVNLSKGRGSCNSNHSKKSHHKCRKYAMDEINNPVKENIEAGYQCDSEPSANEKDKDNRNSLAFVSLLSKESDTNTIYESRLEDEPLKDLHMFFDNHPFFDKNNYEVEDPDDQESLNVTNDETTYIVNSSHASLNKDECRSLSYQVSLLNERNVSSTSNLSPQKKSGEELLKKDMRRSLGSLLSKSIESNSDLQPEPPAWALIRLPPDGTSDPLTPEQELYESRKAIQQNHVVGSKDKINECNSYCLPHYESSAEIKFPKKPKIELQDSPAINGNHCSQRTKNSSSMLYDANEAYHVGEDTESKKLLIPVLNLPRAVSCQNVESLSETPTNNCVKRSASISELDSLT